MGFGTSRSGRRRRPAAVALALFGCVLLVAGCTRGRDHAAPNAGSEAGLAGAGATFPAPLYAKWLDDFQASGAAGVRIS
jgi:ABC-type phosphate transport system substrate-binding protein